MLAPDALGNRGAALRARNPSNWTAVSGRCAEGPHRSSPSGRNVRSKIPRHGPVPSSGLVVDSSIFDPSAIQPRSRSPGLTLKYQSSLILWPGLSLGDRKSTVAEPLARLWTFIRSPISSAQTPGDRSWGTLPPIVTIIWPELKKSLQTRMFRAVAPISTVCVSPAIRVTVPKCAAIAWPPVRQTPAPIRAAAAAVKNLMGRGSTSSVAVTASPMPKPWVKSRPAARPRHEIVNVIYGAQALAQSRSSKRIDRQPRHLLRREIGH